MSPITASTAARGWSRRTALQTAVAPAAVTLAGCVPGSGGGAGDAPPAPSARPATIQFWPIWSSPFQLDGIAQVVAAYKAAAPETSVEVTT